MKLQIYVYALAQIYQVKKKRPVKNIRFTTLEVAKHMLADVSGAYSAISSVNLFQYITHVHFYKIM